MFVLKAKIIVFSLYNQTITHIIFALFFHYQPIVSGLFCTLAECSIISVIIYVAQISSSSRGNHFQLGKSTNTVGICKTRFCIVRIFSQHIFLNCFKKFWTARILLFQLQKDFQSEFFLGTKIFYFKDPLYAMTQLAIAI